MAKNDVGLTGSDIVKSARGHSVRLPVPRCLFIVFLALMLTVSVYFLRQDRHRLYMLLFCLCIGATENAAQPERE